MTDDYTEAEVRLANRNPGIMLEMLRHDVTPVGAHYILTHFDVPAMNPDTYQLSFADGFDAPYSLDLDDIRALPRVDMPVTMECAGNGRRHVSPRSKSMPWGGEAVGTALWGGTPLAPLIRRASPATGSVDVVFSAPDRGLDKGAEHNFARSLTLEQIEALDVLLVYEMNNQPLLPQHGAPLRLIVPGWYGMASVKWLTRIDAIQARFQGHQQVVSYCFRDQTGIAGTPVTSLRVRALMVPPGVPDWTSRMRYVAAGPVRIEGRAWSGGGVPIQEVEFSSGGAWHKAQLSPPAGRYAWSHWQYDWQAEPGEHVLHCRARDANGVQQPLSAPFDIGGLGNNAVQSVPVVVREP